MRDARSGSLRTNSSWAKISAFLVPLSNFRVNPKRVNLRTNELMLRMLNMLGITSFENCLGLTILKAFPSGIQVIICEYNDSSSKVFLRVSTNSSVWSTGMLQATIGVLRSEEDVETSFLVDSSPCLIMGADILSCSKMDVGVVLSVYSNRAASAKAIKVRHIATP
jgi:hypothetical protein